MSEPNRPLRPGRGSSRPSPASLGIVKVDADFEDEYPGGDTTCTEAYASCAALVRPCWASSTGASPRPSAYRRLPRRR